MALRVVKTGDPSFQTRHEFPLNEIVHRFRAEVASASVAVHPPIIVEPLNTSILRLSVVPDRAITTLLLLGPLIPKSIIRSQLSLLRFAELPKLASKSTVIPELKRLELICGKVINGPDALVPPLNFHAPEAGSSSKDPGIEEDRVASLAFPDKSLTVVVGPNEFKSEAL